jgi:hypothetical protein
MACKQPSNARVERRAALVMLIEGDLSRTATLLRPRRSYWPRVRSNALLCVTIATGFDDSFDLLDYLVRFKVNPLSRKPQNRYCPEHKHLVATPVLK